MKDRCKYTFVHVAFQGGVDFIYNLINFFNTDCHDSERREHLWVTHSKELYEKQKDSCDIVYSELSEVGMINQYGDLGKHVIVHGLHSDGFALMRIKPRLIKKITWRTWGHDISLPKPHPSNPLKTIYRYTSFLPYYYITRRFSLVGTANVVDDIKVNKFYHGKMKTHKMPYCKPQEEQRQANRQLEEATAEPDECIRVMIGHSGFHIDNHIEIIDRVARFANPKVKFYVMLSYGEEAYMDQVEAHARKLLGDSCVIFRDRLSYGEYVKFIKSIDVAIFAMQNSSALGNVALLVYYHKKIYLNPAGDIAKGFDQMKLPYGDVNELDQIRYSDFIKPLEYDEQCVRAYLPHFYDATYYKKQWEEIMELLDEKGSLG